jgi:hypothetical protein
MRKLLVIGITTLACGCGQAPEPRIGSVRSAVPNPLSIVGEAGPGEIAAAELRSDGLPVETSFNGRAAGITTFCSGNAHALALAPEQDLNPEERARCRELKEGWGWSALSTQRGTIFYVRHEFAQNLLDIAPTAL